jgi:hypothetical protein
LPLCGGKEFFIMQNDFFVVEIGGFSQYKYAWFETTDSANYSNEAPQCPTCSRYIGPIEWLPPYDVVIKQPRTVGDFVSGVGGCDFLASSKLLSAIEESRLSGIAYKYPITVRKMGTTKTSIQRIPPTLTGIKFVHSKTRVNFDKMGVVWSKVPSDDSCKLCGLNGTLKSWTSVAIDQKTWSGDDFFHAINFPGALFASARAAAMIVSGEFSNVRVVPCEQSSYSFSA